MNLHPTTATAIAAFVTSPVVTVMHERRLGDLRISYRVISTFDGRKQTFTAQIGPFDAKEHEWYRCGFDRAVFLRALEDVESHERRTRLALARLEAKQQKSEIKSSLDPRGETFGRFGGRRLHGD